MSTGYRARVTAGILFSSAVLIPFWLLRLVGSGSGYALDAFEYHYPSYLWIYSRVAEGSLPLWNPFQLCGIPTLATLQGGLLYPPHLLYLWLPTHLGMAVSGLLHLWLIAISMLLIGFRLRLGLLASLLATVLVSMRGAQPGHILNPSMQEAGAWVGIGVLGVLDLCAGSRTRGTALLSLATGMSLLAGFPQLSVYSVYSWGLLLGLLLLQERGAGGEPRGRHARAALGCALAGVALGTAIAAVEILPALELSSVGGRQRGVLPPQLMFPLGGLGFETPWRALQTALSSRPALPGVAFGFGWVGLALLPLAFFNRRQRSRTVAFGALGLLALCFALGPATPLFDSFLLLPEVGSFRNPWRILFVTDFCFAITAAIGLDTLLRRSPARKAGATEKPGFGRRAIPALRPLAAAILAAALIEILVAAPNRTELPYDASSRLLQPYRLQRSVLSSLSRQPDRVWTWLLGDMGSVSEKLSSVFEFRSISDYEIMTLRRQREYFSYLMWGELEPKRLNRRGHSQRIFYGYYSLLAPGVDVDAVIGRSRLVEIAAARYLLVPQSAVGTPAVLHYLRERQLRPVDVSDGQIMVFEQPRALPRAYLTHRVKPAPAPGELLAALARPDFDPIAESYVEIGSEPVPKLAPGGEGERAQIVEDGVHRVVIEAHLTAPGLLVLADSFYPGWSAEVDGEGAPIFATNHLFRGVPLPAGTHRVVFRYRPVSVLAGGVVSLAAASVLVGLGISCRRRG